MCTHTRRLRLRAALLGALSAAATGLLGATSAVAAGSVSMEARSPASGVERPSGTSVRNGRGTFRPSDSNLRGVARRFYDPSSRYWTHTLPTTPSYAVATRPGRIGMIVAPVMINGQGPFRFLLDTGANRTVLAGSTVAKLALESSPNDRILVRGISGLTAVPLVHVASVASGTLQIHDLSAPVMSGPVFDGIDGILGMDGLAGMRLTADFVRDRVVISSSSGASPSALYALHGRFVSQRLLLVQGRINSISTAAVIDTGAGHTLGNEALLAALTHAYPTATASAKEVGVDVTDTAQPGTERRIPTLQFGTADINNLQVTFGDYGVFKTWGLQGKPALLLGMDVLGSLAYFSIDYDRAELQVLPWPAGNG
jgi:predicted aspartyl protease